MEHTYKRKKFESWAEIKNIRGWIISRGLFLFLAIIFGGCSLILDNKDTNKRAYLPAFSGASGEILVVLKDQYWEGKSGKAIQLGLEQFCEYLSGSEPLFNLVQISESQFNKLFRVHRNILKVNIGSKKEKKSPITISRGKWSKDQLVIEITVDNENTFTKLFRERHKQLINLFNEADLSRVQKKFLSLENDAISEKLKTKYGFSVVVPKDAELAMTTDDFIWIKRDRKRILTGNAGATHDVNENIFIRIQNYSDSSMFSSNSILDCRDSFGKKYVSGPVDGSYMVTEREFFLPQRKELSWNKQYGVELRGLWKLEGFFMGGPFISLTTVDRLNRRLITIEGNVFAPKFSKREYVRELEAIVYSFKENFISPS